MRPGPRHPTLQMAVGESLTKPAERHTRQWIVEYGVGDQIFLLGGVPLPLVLREATIPGTYFVVESAYVHGMMNGETVRGSTDLDEVILV